MADIRAKAILLTKAEADYVRLLVMSTGSGAYMRNEKAGILRKLSGLTEVAPVVTTGLYGSLKDRL
jgi:hypothetical protein